MAACADPLLPTSLEPPGYSAVISQRFMQVLMAEQAWQQSTETGAQGLEDLAITYSENNSMELNPGP